MTAISPSRIWWRTYGLAWAVNHVRFFDFPRPQTADLGRLPGTIEDWVGGFTVSKDRRTVVYSQRTYQSSEVMLVDHFR